MVTFLVLSIIMTIVTAGAAILATVAITFWSAVVDTTNCEMVAGSCVCYNDYETETYNGKITEFKFQEKQKMHCMSMTTRTKFLFFNRQDDIQLLAEF